MGNTVHLLHDLVNVINRIGNTRILGHTLVRKINLPIGIHCHVLQQCISANGIINIRFGFFVQIDHLCIASALKIEDAIVIPAMLIIAD